jgi:hypothetical protein
MSLRQFLSILSFTFLPGLLVSLFTAMMQNGWLTDSSGFVDITIHIVRMCDTPFKIIGLLTFFLWISLSIFRKTNRR